MSMLASTIASFWTAVQTTLFPALEAAGVPLSPKLARLVAILEIVQIERAITGPSPYQRGVRPTDRRCLARALLAKAYYGLPHTKALRERLLADPALRHVCGWSHRAAVPSEATFSRAFRVFAETGLTDQVHVALVTAWRGDTLVWHAATDATAIPARERPQPHPTGPLYRDPTRLVRQQAMAPEVALLELATACSVAGKQHRSGKVRYWTGYKLHVTVDEWGLPLAAVTTAAAVHDNQVAIPLLHLVHRRVRVLYDLMDKAYDAEAIEDLCLRLGHRPLIDRMTRGGPAPPPLEPDRARQYQGRTVVERCFARLKDEFGGLCVRVRGYRKVHTHLMFGLLVLFADQLLRIA
jgi:IS5 family transposase